MNTRIANVQKQLAEHNLDAVLISATSNIFYLTGFAHFSTQERDAFLLITKNNAHLLTNILYEEAVKQSVKGISIFIRTIENPLSRELERISKNIQTVGIEEHNLTVLEYKAFKKYFKLKPAAFLEDIRVIKDKAEIAAIAKACEIADNALSIMMQQIKPDMSEKQVAYIIDQAMREQGSEPSFPTIVCFGQNAADIHHSPTDTILKKQDLILVDMGAKYNGYCSDMSRTFFMGKATDKQKKLYETVATAQQKALAVIKNGVPAKIIDGTANNYIVSQDYPPLPHASHGTGIEVHEAPSLSQYSKDILANGMVFSVEPGIYLPGFGGARIEDLVALENGKPIELTKSPKTLIEL